MIGITIKILVGLFIWLFMPEWLIIKTKSKKNQKKFINLACMLVGVLILFFSAIDLIKFLLNLR